MPTDDLILAEKVRRHLKKIGDHTIAIPANADTELRRSEVVTNILLCQINQLSEFKRKRDFLSERNERNFNEFKREHPYIGRCAANNTCLHVLHKIGVMKIEAD